MAPTDRRQYARVPIDTWVTETHGSVTYCHRSANLSVGGMFIEGTISHKPGTIVTLSFGLPGDNAPITLRGEVLPLPSGQLGMRIQFVDVTQTDRLRLDAAVSSRLTDFADTAVE